MALKYAPLLPLSPLSVLELKKTLSFCSLRFNERISRTYRREKWRDILDAILEMSYASAVKIGDYETAIRTVFGLLAPGA